MTSTALPTNANFQQVLDELALLGDEATRNPIADPLYQQFIARFPADRLPQLSLAEYCVGKGDGESFCWWLERGLQPVMGRYMPGTSRGHILYFQKDGTVYKNRRLTSLSDADALRYTLKIQACIAQADMSQDPHWIDSDAQVYERAGVEPRVTVGEGRKLRLLACYHPDQTLPISSSPHLGHFLEVLGYAPADVPNKRQPVARMLLLRRYFELARQSVPGLTPFGFMKALYSERLGLAPVKEDDAADDADLDDGKDARKTGKAPTSSSGSPVRQPLNQILYGPPGTGKTYASIDAALAILDPAFLAANLSDRKALKARFDEFERERRVRFVTFHQSFSYEDFVEGLRARLNDHGQLEYSVEPGSFKRLCDEARPRIAAGTIQISPNARVWKLSIAGTGPSQTKAYCLAHDEARIGWGQTGDLTQSLEDNDYYKSLGNGDHGTLRYFAEEMAAGDVVLCIHSAEAIAAVGVVTGDYRFEAAENLPKGLISDYQHVRPVKWLYTGLALPISPINDNKNFTLKTVYQMNRLNWAELQSYLERQGCKPVAGVVDEVQATEPYVLIIDEINRGNISRIFGELITLIEPSKRAGAPEALEALLPYSKKPFSVPSNVYLVGTMNTADRSLAAMDVALRRRFVFKEMPPRPGLLQGVEVGAIKIDELLSVINQRIEALLDRDHCVGHAYFMPLREDPSAAKLAEIFRVQVLPLLQEYFFDDWQRIQWVLNDHRKRNAAYRFITASDVNTVSLFGDAVNIARSPQLWRVNEDAFLCEQSYLGVINHEDASD